MFGSFSNWKVRYFSGTGRLCWPKQLRWLVRLESGQWASLRLRDRPDQQLVRGLQIFSETSQGRLIRWPNFGYSFDREDQEQWWITIKEMNSFQEWTGKKDFVLVLTTWSVGGCKRRKQWKLRNPKNGKKSLWSKESCLRTTQKNRSTTDHHPWCLKRGDFCEQLSRQEFVQTPIGLWFRN